jgi:hypothetical protein
VQDLAAEGACTAFFAFWARSEKQRKITHLMSTLLWQLLRFCPRDKFQEIAQTILTNLPLNRQTLQQCIEESLQSIENPAYMIVDGLDESLEDWIEPTGGSLGLIVEWIKRYSQLHVLFLGRFSALHKAAKRFPFVEVTANVVENDISEFVASSFHSMSCSITRELRQQIQKQLVINAKQLFLWVELVFVQLRRCASMLEITLILDEIPRGLDGEYRRLLTQVIRNFQNDMPDSNSQFAIQRARNLFSIILGSAEPLSLDDLRLLYAFSFGENEKICIDSLITDEGILRLCGGFISYENGRVFLAHASCAEFLTSSSSNDQTSGESLSLHVDYNDCQEVISRTCLNYLQSVNWGYPLQDGDPIQLIRQWPLLQYAHRYFMFHIVQYDGPKKSDLRKTLTDFIKSASFSGWFEYLMLNVFGDHSDESVQHTQEMQYFIVCLIAWYDDLDTGTSLIGAIHQRSSTEVALRAIEFPNDQRTEDWIAIKTMIGAFELTGRDEDSLLPIHTSHTIAHSTTVAIEDPGSTLEIQPDQIAFPSKAVCRQPTPKPIEAPTQGVKSYVPPLAGSIVRSDNLRLAIPHINYVFASLNNLTTIQKIAILSQIHPPIDWFARLRIDPNALLRHSLLSLASSLPITSLYLMTNRSINNGDRDLARSLASVAHTRTNGQNNLDESIALFAMANTILCFEIDRLEVASGFYLQGMKILAKLSSPTVNSQLVVVILCCVPRGPLECLDDVEVQEALTIVHAFAKQIVETPERPLSWKRFISKVLIADEDRCQALLELCMWCNRNGHHCDAMSIIGLAYEHLKLDPANLSTHLTSVACQKSKSWLKQRVLALVQLERIEEVENELWSLGFVATPELKLLLRLRKSSHIHELLWLWIDLYYRQAAGSEEQTLFLCNLAAAHQVEGSEEYTIRAMSQFMGIVKRHGVPWASGISDANTALIFEFFSMNQRPSFNASNARVGIRSITSFQLWLSVIMQTTFREEHQVPKLVKLIEIIHDLFYAGNDHESLYTLRKYDVANEWVDLDEQEIRGMGCLYFIRSEMLWQVVFNLGGADIGCNIICNTLKNKHGDCISCRDIMSDSIESLAFSSDEMTTPWHIQALYSLAGWFESKHSRSDKFTALSYIYFNTLAHYFEGDIDTSISLITKVSSFELDNVWDCCIFRRVVFIHFISTKIYLYLKSNEESQWHRDSGKVICGKAINMSFMSDWKCYTCDSCEQLFRWLMQELEDEGY